MRNLDDGPDGLNDAAFDRALAKAPHAKKQRVPVVSIDPCVAAAINAGENEYRQKVLGQGPLPGHDVVQSIPVIPAVSHRHLDLFTSALGTDTDCSTWEHRAPGSCAALMIWAGARGLSVDVRDTGEKAICYTVTPRGPTHETFCVYVRSAS